MKKTATLLLAFLALPALLMKPATAQQNVNVYKAVGKSENLSTKVESVDAEIQANQAENQNLKTTEQDEIEAPKERHEKMDARTRAKYVPGNTTRQNRRQAKRVYSREITRRSNVKTAAEPIHSHPSK